VRFLALATSDDAAFDRLTSDASAALAESEARRTWELAQAGTIRSIDFRTDRRDVVLVLEADDEIAVQAILETLPMVEARLVSFEIIGLRPYDGWARLVGEPA
jgi:muconolactone delta-isomerase